MSRNKAGQMAIVIKSSTLEHGGVELPAVKVGTPVMPKALMCTEPCESWLLEEPIRFEVTFPCGCIIKGFVADYFDQSLLPVRDPDEDAVDEMVEKLGAAPKTLTEVREVQHG